MIGERIEKIILHLAHDRAQLKSNSPKAILADLAFEESAFPKHTDDFDEVSRFLEEHASFSFNLGDFDVIWQEYLEH